MGWKGLFCDGISRHKQDRIPCEMYAVYKLFCLQGSCRYAGTLDFSTPLFMRVFAQGSVCFAWAVATASPHLPLDRI